MNDLDLEYTGIFTESSEDIGLLYSEYKDMKDDVTKLLEKIEDKIKFFLKDPKNYVINLKDDIDQFKKSTGRKLSPKEIDIRGVKSQKKEIKDFKNDLDKILKKYSSMKDKIAFGGNYFRAILKRPKVYSKEIDYDAYESINRNIRNIDRAMDWIEKVLMDLYNMADHDLNVLTLVGEVYAKRRIYESFDPSRIPRPDTDDVYDLIIATSRYNPEEAKIKTITDAVNQYCMESDDNLNGEDNLDWIESYLESYLMEDAEPSEEPPSIPDTEQEKTEEPKPEKESMPKKTDRAESSKNGVRRKKLYIAFIEWCKEYNTKNTFGSIFDKDAFKISYPFVPEEMRYFYRLSNPMLCVLGGDLTFFPVAELRKLNSKNSHLNEMMIFAATPNDLRVFNHKDKKIYRGIEENGALKLNEVLGETFDGYIQKMINKGDILNGPIEESADIDSFSEDYY